jgi:hypothetical protein
VKKVVTPPRFEIVLCAADADVSRRRLGPCQDQPVNTHGASGHWVSLGERAWHIETIWRASEGLPVEDVAIAQIQEVDEDCWFRGGPATVRAVIDHTRSILAADLSQPIILAADGQVLDGMHRIGKAILSGYDTVSAQRLAQDPAPDWVVSRTSRA